MGAATETASGVERWRKIARRVRVPLGFLVAAIFLVFAHSTWRTLLWSVLLVVPGLWLRGYAAGYVKKNAELTRTGPYAYTRNPLYLGSMSLAAGFAPGIKRGSVAPVILAMALISLGVGAIWVVSLLRGRNRDAAPPAPTLGPKVTIR